jgi:hypothetical protein
MKSWTQAFLKKALLPCRGLDRVTICEGLGLALPTTSDDIGGRFDFGAPYRL